MVEKKHFISGLIIGIVVSSLFLHFFAPRYTTSEYNGVLIKNDKWTGDSWRFIDNQWKKNLEVDQDWESIDKTLRSALNIPMEDTNRTKVLTLLRKTHPLLENVADDDLLERIKIVYSKEILINLYLNNFLKLQKKEGPLKKQGEISQNVSNESGNMANLSHTFTRSEF